MLYKSLKLRNALIIVEINFLKCSIVLNLGSLHYLILSTLRSYFLIYFMYSSDNNMLISLI
jgi:hypothetical protein